MEARQLYTFSDGRFVKYEETAASEAPVASEAPAASEETAASDVQSVDESVRVSGHVDGSAGR